MRKDNFFHTMVFQKPYFSWVVFAAALLCSFLAFKVSQTNSNLKAYERFYFRVADIQKNIKERLNVYEQVLWSGVGFIYAVESLNRSNFSKFIKTADIEKNWPGIQGVGYSIPIQPDNKKKHIERIRAEGFPEFIIKPAGSRDQYTSIIYLEPFDWRNRRAFGYDMWSNPMRREAMKRARDLGEAATSGIITLVQETDQDTQRGFLTYVPVYDIKTIPLTLEERRAHFQGWVYAPFRAKNLMEGVLGSDKTSVDFEVYDGDLMSENTLLYDSNPLPHNKDSEHSPSFATSTRVVNQGRVWTLYFHASRDFMYKDEQRQPFIVFFIGLIISVLLFCLVYGLYFIHSQTEKRAQELHRSLKQRTEELESAKINLEKHIQKRTQELEDARELLEQQVEERTAELRAQMKDLESINKVMVGREIQMVEMKKELEQLRKNKQSDSA